MRKLDEQRLPDITGADSGGIKCLNEAKHTGDFIGINLEVGSKFFDRHFEQTVVVEVANDVLPDFQVFVGGFGELQLLNQVVVQRVFGDRRVFEHFLRLLGNTPWNEFGPLLEVRVPIEVVFRPRLGRLHLRLRRLTDQLFLFNLLLLSLERFDLFEKRVGGEFLTQGLLQLQHRHLQHLQRLNQLRRHYLAESQSQFEFHEVTSFRRSAYGPMLYRPSRRLNLGLSRDPEEGYFQSGKTTRPKPLSFIQIKVLWAVKSRGVRKSDPPPTSPIIVIG